MRCLVIGIGNPLRGDDYVGIYVAKRVKRCRGVEVGTNPELSISFIRRERPDVAIFVDAAHMGLEPGEIRLLEPEDLAEGFMTTHTIPLGLILGHIGRGTRIIIVGIQPERDEGYFRLSKRVRDAARKVVEALDRGDYFSFPRFQRPPR